MRKFRKTRKTRHRVHRGGVPLGEENVYVCPPGTNYSDCMQGFLTTNNLFLINIPGDGDCFYKTLSTYGLIMGYTPINHPPPILRKIVMNNIFRNYDNYQAFFPAQNGETALQKRQRDLKEIVNSSKPGEWAHNLGDIPMQVAPSLFHINIIITDIQRRQDGSIVFNRTNLGAGPEHSYVPTLPRIDMLRVNSNHYNLLLSQATDFASYYDHPQPLWRGQGSLTQGQLQSFVNPTGSFKTWVDAVYAVQLPSIRPVNANQKALVDELKNVNEQIKKMALPPTAVVENKSKTNRGLNRAKRPNNGRNCNTIKNINMRLKPSND